MTRIVIKSTKVDLERGQALRLAIIDGRSERAHLKASDLDREAVAMRDHLHHVADAARQLF